MFIVRGCKKLRCNSHRFWSSESGSKTSSLAGQSGRIYVRDRILQTHPRKPELNVYLAHSEKTPFVLKPVSQSIFGLSQELQAEFGKNARLRTHVDENAEERTLVYEFFDGNLLSLIKHNADLPLRPRKAILKEMGLGLRDLHRANWIHLDTKANNVLLNWTGDPSGQFEVGRVVWADMDCALKLKADKLLNARIGNVMWRSPEGQLGRGVGKPSEVFSFGLLCLYTITGVETLHPDFEQLKRDGTEPELVILYKLLSMFGPVPPELSAHVNDDNWTDLLEQLTEVVLEEGSEMRFANWDESAFPNLDIEAKRLISMMTNLDPAKRATMEEIMQDSWWDA